MHSNQTGSIRRWQVAVLAIVLIAVTAALMLPFVFGCRENCFARDNLVAVSKRTIRLFNLMGKGETRYVDGEMARQVTAPATQSQMARTALETALLPIEVRSHSLPDAKGYPLGAGGLTVVNGRLLVLDRLGRIYSYADGKIKEATKPVPNGVRDFIASSTNTSLTADTFRTHSIAFDPDGRRLFACYEKYVSPGKNRFEIASIAFDPESLASNGDWRVEYGTEEFSSAVWGIAGGGKLLVDRGMLYFSVGDYSFYGRPGHALEHAAQDPKQPFGKIHVMSLVDRKVRPLSIGHRNTQGLAMSDSGRLFNVEQGPQGGDEVNLIIEGKNYGWPVQTFGTDYGTYTWPYQQDDEKTKLQPPFFAFVPSIATSSIIQVRGWHARWNGDFLVGSLKAQSLYRLKMIEDRVVFSEPIWIGHRVRDIAQSADVIYLLTDDGLVMELRADAELIRRNARGVDAAPSKTLAKCLGCHHMGETNPTHLAPSLAQLKDRKIASDGFQRYSTALKGLQGNWDKDRLMKFLENPAVFAPGTAMPKVELTRGEIEEIATQLLGK